MIGEITKGLEVRGLAKDYPMVERGSAPFYMGSMYLMQEASGSEVLNVGTCRYEVLASLGPKDSNTDLTITSRRL